MISAIFQLLERDRFANPGAGAALDRLDLSLGLSPMDTAAVPTNAMLEADRIPLPLTRRAGVEGYDKGFLSVPIDLSAVYAPALAAGLVAPLLDGLGHELAYHHFSAVIRADRCFPLLTAVNISGKRLVHPGARKDTWRRDAGIDARYQPDGDFYEKAKGHDQVQFSRGHQVRLLAPCWSDSDDEATALAEARLGSEDTFHYTNAAPQVQHYNDIDWGDAAYALGELGRGRRDLVWLQGFRALVALDDRRFPFSQVRQVVPCSRTATGMLS
ncbi:DNA/RNA non-specific endonuclease [Sphingomonas sp. Leaf198]|uniref:DNA/RNA non-specific endonuclease n=1 Tax=Sphingomonas sp. Leaf198 TaxID=1736299 RepID=UPI0006FFB863|nr:DNA/RNA non-specific endonuclease [Sphingomonas sp. Leaf198]KQS49507.1 hypothetical protein ASG20_10950 [Sphingomonas sp. Leaf198]